MRSVVELDVVNVGQLDHQPFGAGAALFEVGLLEAYGGEGLDPDTVRLDDPLSIEWRGGGPAVWSADSEES